MRVIKTSKQMRAGDLVNRFRISEKLDRWYVLPPGTRRPPDPNWAPPGYIWEVETEDGDSAVIIGDWGENSL